MFASMNSAPLSGSETLASIALQGLCMAMEEFAWSVRIRLLAVTPCPLADPPG